VGFFIQFLNTFFESFSKKNPFENLYNINFYEEGRVSLDRLALDGS